MRKDPLLVLKTPVPQIAETEAHAILREHYGMRASLEPLVSERDQNFLVTVDDGQKFVLKIANSSESADVTDFQTRALQHIEMADPDFPVPRVMHTLENKSVLTTTAADGRNHVVRVLSWLDGVPLRAALGAVRVARPAGLCLARLGLALAEFQHPASDYHLLWDLKRAAELMGLLPHIEDSALRDLCADSLSRFRDHVRPQLADMRQQVIHNDLNPSNILVAPDKNNTLAGVIDFGDIVHSPLIVDVAVAAAYLCASGEDPFIDVLEFLTAYTEIVALEEQEIECLYDLILTRHLMTVTITNWRAARYPDNRDYILRNVPTARAMIGNVMGLDAAAVTERFKRACSP